MFFEILHTVTALVVVNNLASCLWHLVIFLSNQEYLGSCGLRYPSLRYKHFRDWTGSVYCFSFCFYAYAEPTWYKVFPTDGMQRVQILLLLYLFLLYFLCICRQVFFVLVWQGLYVNVENLVYIAKFRECDREIQIINKNYKK